MKRIFSTGLILLLLLFLAGCQLRDAYSGKLILNGAHELPAGSILDGSLVQLGGTFTQQAGSTITGSVQIIGGQAELRGSVAGPVTLLDGALELAPEASLQGDLNALGGTLTQAPQARVAGKQTIRQAPSQPTSSPIPSTAGWFVHLLLEIPLLVLAGYLAARFYPAQIRTVSSALTRHPLMCASTGLLAMIAGLSLAVLMAYTLLLIPASFLLLGWMLLAATFGAVPAAVFVGKIASQRLRGITPGDTQAAMVGMVLLAAMAELLRLVPLVGDLLIIALLLAAFGATLLTRFGGQHFVPDGNKQSLGQAAPPPSQVNPAYRDI